MITFETVSDTAANRCFEQLDNATRHLFNTTMSGRSCWLFMVTWHDKPGPDGLHFQRELLDTREG